MTARRVLTAKQRRFVREYLLDLNAAAAYRRAGYKVQSNHQASVNAARLMAKDSITAAIAAAQRQRQERTEITADLVLQRLDRESERRGHGSSHSARVQALKLLGLHLGMFPKKVQLTGKDGGPVRFSAAEWTDDELARIIADDDSKQSAEANAPAGGGGAAAAPSGSQPA